MHSIYICMYIYKYIHGCTHTYYLCDSFPKDNVERFEIVKSRSCLVAQIEIHVVPKGPTSQQFSGPCVTTRFSNHARDQA